ncbi:hypothetical protein [Prauserella cavernicola]|uniref:Uncharacterized protein n=1 Tax=Prauserella cavernicola TaxID=2800127 RepID=A0A934V933_9PSEU|nr:hypothetical protein [Prauserella cavernicola]MBK1788428.1 hypothetical protein [Prauserella cavernicola]
MTGRDAELIQEVCDTLVAAVPGGSRRVRLHVWASVVVFRLEFSVGTADGQAASVETPPELTGTLTELRREMYAPDRGTWFSAWFDLRAGEPPEAGFNFDRDPRWLPDVPAAVFARDLESFPRADEYIPRWLRERLAEAAVARAS